MANKPDLADYIEVPDRIRSFMAKYPEGSLQGEHQLVEVGDHVFVQYIARAYRTPTDERPGVGTTWEPFPGTTPYTRNSEVENAETSAWGRALAALGFIGKKIATQDEIERRQAEQSGDSRGGGNASKAQITLVRRLFTQNRVTQGEAKKLLAVAGVTVGDGESARDACERLRWPGVSELIDTLKDGPVPTGETDVPADASGFEASPADEGQVPFFSQEDER